MRYGKQLPHNRIKTKALPVGAKAKYQRICDKIDARVVHLWNEGDGIRLCCIKDGVAWQMKDFGTDVYVFTAIGHEDIIVSNRHPH